MDTPRTGLSVHPDPRVPCIYCGQGHPVVTSTYQPHPDFPGVCLPVLWTKDYPAPEGQPFGEMIPPEHGQQVLIVTREGYRLAIVQRVDASPTRDEVDALSTIVGFGIDHCDDETVAAAAGLLKRLQSGALADAVSWDDDRSTPLADIKQAITDIAALTHDPDIDPLLPPRVRVGTRRVRKQDRLYHVEDGAVWCAIGTRNPAFRLARGDGRLFDRAVCLEWDGTRLLVWDDSGRDWTLDEVARVVRFNIHNDRRFPTPPDRIYGVVEEGEASGVPLSTAQLVKSDTPYLAFDQAVKGTYMRDAVAAVQQEFEQAVSFPPIVARDGEGRPVRKLSTPRRDRG